MQYNCYNVVSVWGAAPPRPPAGESPSSSAPLPTKTSYATGHSSHCLNNKPEPIMLLILPIILSRISHHFHPCYHLLFYIIPQI